MYPAGENCEPFTAHDVQVFKMIWNGAPISKSFSTIILFYSSLIHQGPSGSLSLLCTR
jgi:hypothetical protein